MTTIATLTTEEVINRRLQIEKNYSKAIAIAKKIRNEEINKLRDACPHKNSDSGEGGSLDYWYECKDCGADSPFPSFRSQN